jgi:hypothetical protein
MQPHLGGNVHDTINGALGFFAFFAPAGVLVVAVALLALRTRTPDISMPSDVSGSQ